MPDSTVLAGKAGVSSNAWWAPTAKAAVLRPKGARQAGKAGLSTDVKDEESEFEAEGWEAMGEQEADAEESSVREASHATRLEPIAKHVPPTRPGRLAGTPSGRGSGASATAAMQPEPAKAEEPQEAVLETDDWVKQFERKWAEAMGDASEVKEEAEEEDPVPPAKRPRGDPAPQPSRKRPAQDSQGPVVQTGKLAPRQPAGPPPPNLMASRGPAPITPGVAGVLGRTESPAAPGISDAQIRDERPEWSSRCTIEPAKPGQPQRLVVSMAEVELGDEGLSDWCSWMDRRLHAAQPSSAGPVGRTRFRAGTIDFSENKLGVAGVKSLCAMLEKHGVRSEVLRLTGNLIGNEGMRCIARYLMSSSQAPALELHLSRNRVTAEGVKWLLGCLAMHPAYPIWNNDTERFVPLWLRLENNRVKAAVGYKALEAACGSLSCAACLGERSGDTRCGPRQCVNVGCCDELKHNCVAHLCGWETPEGAEPLPAPVAHARPFFAPAGRGAPRAPPSGAEAPLRDEPRVVYEDEDLAVVLKPAGWSCLPQPRGVDPAWARLKPLARRKQVAELMSQEVAPPLQAWLLLHFGADPNCDASRDQSSDRGLAHRLDLDTSGPILVGKTLKGYEHARKQILAGLLRDYVALVQGTFSTDRGECHAPIDASGYAEDKCVRIEKGGQAATTVWEALAEYESSDRKERYTLLHCRMATLRTHQIRVHLQHLGHPLVGDRLYGVSEAPSFCPRIFLHKIRIGFFNLKGQACIETCTLQTVPDLWKALGRLRKVGGMAMMGCGAPGL